MPQFVCCDCGRKQDSTEALKSHISIKHLQYQPFECSRCPRHNHCTKEATEDEMILHINETHPGKDIRYVCIPDPYKHQLLKDKMQQSVNPGVDGDNKQLNRSAPPVNAPVEQHEVMSKLEEDESGDDFEPETPSAPTTGASRGHQQPPAGHQSPLNSRITNSAREHTEVKPELMVGDDPDDDFVPDPPINNNGDSQSQQPVVVGNSSSVDAKDVSVSDSGVGSSSQQHSSIDGGTRKLKKVKGKKGETGRNAQDNKGKTKKMAPKSATRDTCRGAKMIRIRSEDDVAKEMVQLRQTHFRAMVPREFPYKCIKCKRGVSKNVFYHILKHHLKVEQSECPVCGWSGNLTAVKTHMQQRHRSCDTRPIFNATNYKDQIRVIEKDIIVKNM